MRSLLREYVLTKRYGIDFISGLYEANAEKGLLGDSKNYEGTHFERFSEVLDYLRIAPDDVFVDIGCGKGKALFFAALRKPRKVVGVELVREHAGQAQQAAQRLSLNLGVPIEIINGDAATTRVDDGTIYYLFNPFGPSTLRLRLTTSVPD
jgi:SAM-dependent methyltransferase